MKKILYLLILISIISSSVSVEGISILNTPSGTVITGTSFLQANLVNQDPYPADPGAYANLLFKIENIGTNNSENTTLELIPEYPFLLDSGVSAVTQLGTIYGKQTGNNSFLAMYKVRVDKDAINGDNEIKLKYSEGDGSVYNIETFNVSVSNPRTDFDVVVQDSTDLAIANIGANTAQSVIVRIPDQSNFRVNGTSASIVGNLNAGDYTLVTFQLLPVRTSNISSGSSNLTVEISYTDTLGIRRTIQKNISYEFATGLGNLTGRTFTRTGQSQLSLSNGILYIIVGAAGIVVIVVIIKIRTRKKK